MPRWTPEARQKQADQARRTRPWEKSTGPRTPAGKAIARYNNLRHGRRTPWAQAQRRTIVEGLRVQRLYLEN